MGEENFDTLLLAIAEKQKDGIPQFLDTIASFLRRKTDFFTGVSQEKWEGLLLHVFRKQYEKVVVPPTGNGSKCVSKQDAKKSKEVTTKELSEKDVKQYEIPILFSVPTTAGSTLPHIKYSKKFLVKAWQEEISESVIKHLIESMSNRIEPVISSKFSRVINLKRTIDSNASV